MSWRHDANPQFPLQPNYQSLPKGGLLGLQRLVVLHMMLALGSGTGMTANLLAAKKPREAAGAAAARAFDFQIHVSVAHVLGQHSKHGPYFALFDHFDDFVLVEGEDAKSSISFYQVKSSVDKAWTPVRLAHRGKKGDLPRSIIGKAYYNLEQFGALVRRAAIVSNQPLHAKFASGKNVTADDVDIVLSTLCAGDTKVLLAALAADFSAPLNPAHKDILCYVRSPLNLQSYRDAVLGQVTTFVNSISPEAASVAKPVYDALIMEATRCTGDKSKAKDLAELKARKGIDRAGVDALVDEVRRRGLSPIEWWASVKSELEADGAGAIKQQRIYNQCLAYWLSRKRGEVEATRLSTEIHTAIESNPDYLTDEVLGSAAALVLSRSLQAPSGEPYDLQAALIVELMEHLT